MASFTYKFTNAEVETTPNDVLVTITSFLSDANNFAFLDQFNAIDTFDVATVKTALPASGYDSFLSIMAMKAIGEKYNQTGIGGTSVAGNPVITGMTNTSGLVPGLFVLGNNIPVDTTLVSVRDTTSIRLSAAPTTTGSVSLNFTSSGWAIDFTEITRIITIIDFSSL
jgi:hypothetical protein